MRLGVPLLLLATLPAQWTQVSPPATVGNRAGHGMAGDAAGNVLLFGGTTSFQPLNETWRWDGTTWTQLAPALSPTGRTMIEVVYDMVRNVYVVYGGWTTALSIGNANNQTWEFDGTTWTQAAPTAHAGGLWKYGACYDVARGRVVMYGGSTNGLIGATQNTWEYDATTWTQVPGASQPGPLESPAMCYHMGLMRAVMFGGINPSIGGTDTTWLFDGTTWTAANVTGPKPAPRTGAKMVYDSQRGVCVLFGGMHPQTGVAFADTWEFNGTGWAQSATTATGGRAFGMAFDVVRRQAVRHGGIDNPTTNGETWVYGATATAYGNGCVGSNGIPTLVPVNVPRVGEPWSLTLNGTAVGSPFAIIVLGTSQVAIPLDLLGMFGCTAWTTPDLLLTTPASGGTAPWSMTLPSQPGLVGLHLYAQGLSFDPGFNPAWLVASNGVDGQLGG